MINNIKLIPTIFIFFILFIMIKSYIGNFDYKEQYNNKENNIIDKTNNKENKINDIIDKTNNKINDINNKIDNITLCNKKHNSLIYAEVPQYAYLDHANVLHITKHKDIAKKYGRGKYIQTNIASIHGYPANSKEKYYILTVYKNRIESKNAKPIPKELKQLCIKLRDIQGYYSVIEYI